jgi:recombination protein RecT
MTKLMTQGQEPKDRGMMLAGYLGTKAMRQRLTNALPNYMTPERMIRIALTAATRNPRLLECTPESVGLSLLTAAQIGLEPNGRDAHLVPFKNNKKGGIYECQLIPDYKGLIQLAYRSGQVDNVSAKAVFTGDLFDYELGSNEHLKHIPCEEEDPGELRYAWAMVRFKTGGSKFVVLNKRDIARRRKASQTATRDDSPWQLHVEAMWAKSAVKELSKWMPQTPELERFHKAIEQDDTLEFGGVIDVPSSPVATSKAEDLAARLRQHQDAQNLPNGGFSGTYKAPDAPEPTEPADTSPATIAAAEEKKLAHAQRLDEYRQAIEAMDRTDELTTLRETVKADERAELLTVMDAAEILKTIDAKLNPAPPAAKGRGKKGELFDSTPRPQ